MPRIASFDLPGIELRFYSRDHRPAHFHAKVPGEWEVRVYFLHEPPTYDVAWKVTRISADRLKAVLTGAAEHRSELLEEWSKAVAPDA